MRTLTARAVGEKGSGTRGVPTLLRGPKDGRLGETVTAVKARPDMWRHVYHLPEGEWPGGSDPVKPVGARV